MRRILACLATLALSATAIGARAQNPDPLAALIESSTHSTPPATSSATVGSERPTTARHFDPIGDVLAAAERSVVENARNWFLKATLYHARGAVSARDSLGCRVSPMRTVAVDPAIVSRRSIIFIKETAGMPLDGGGVHDGYWYASDIGGGIKGDRIDLFTGVKPSSMKALAGLNLKTLSVVKVGEFTGCPPIDGGADVRLADAR